MKTKFKNLDSELQGIVDGLRKGNVDRVQLLARVQELGIGSELTSDATISDILTSIVENGGLQRSYPKFADGYKPTGKQYGVRINKNDPNPTSRVEYILDAIGMTPAKMQATGQFDYGTWGDVWFVKNNYPCMVGMDGEEKYKIDPKDYSKKLDGTLSNAHKIDHDMNVMSRIPLIYLKQYEDTTHEYIIVSDVKHDDTWTAFAHTNQDGVIVENLYISTYRGVLLNNKMRSISSAATTASMTASNSFTAAKANGPRYNARTWVQRNLINSLLLIIGKDENSQAVFGNGNVNNTTRLATGILDTAGQFYGSTVNSTTQVKVFHIEGWWGDLRERIEGMVSVKGDIRVKTSPPYNLTGDGYIQGKVVITATLGAWGTTTYNGLIGRIPYGTSGSGAGGSSTTYLCDYLGVAIGITGIPEVGGSWTAGSTAGASCLDLNRGEGSVSTEIGIGISCL